MSDTPKDPRMDWGFYAMTPRIVRTKYKNLSHTEKWLYTCLKDLCGKKGTCFRSLRSLKEETDISIASLSTMIPKLHAAGLIHAEKKRRSASGKEIWHISIVDIWQLNKDYCSEIEQSSSEDVQNLNNDPEIVQSVNNDVQKLNKTSGDCSEIERDCSNFSDRRRDSKNKGTEICNEEEGTGNSRSATLPTPAPSLENTPYRPELTGQSRDATYEEAWEAYKQIEPRMARTNQMLANGEMPTLKAVDTPQNAQTQQQAPAVAELSTSIPQSGKVAHAVKQPPQPSSQAKKPPVPEFSPEGRKVYDAWCSLFKSPPRVGPKTVECADALYPLLVPWCKELHVSCAALLDEIKGQMYTADTKGFYKRGITLCDVERDFEKWQSAKTQELAELAQKAAPKQKEPSAIELLRAQQQRYAPREGAAHV